MTDRKYWKITYLPATYRPSVVQWVFNGTKEELDSYLLENHGCNCSDCKDATDWWATANCYEYDVEEVNPNEL